MSTKVVRRVRHTNAVEYIRTMRGGSQAKLMRCSDGGYYVVKFQNNPQGARTLANDLIGTVLAAMLGLPVPEPAIVNVDQDLIRFTDDLAICFRYRKEPCREGLCFGSRYPMIGETLSAVYDLFPLTNMSTVINLADFLGMLVFDKWTGNADNRQVIFVREDRPHDDSPHYHHRALMIDQGQCFDGSNWNFPDVPKKGVFFSPRPYANVDSIEAFKPWIEGLDCVSDNRVLEEIAADIPRDWYAGDSEGLSHLLAELDARRAKVRHLLVQTRCAIPRLFPAWNSSELGRKAGRASLSFG